MSRWTHVYGEIELSKNIVNTDHSGMYITSEQVVETKYKSSLTGGSGKLDIIMTSFPALKTVVDEGLKIFTSGEYEVITEHFLNEATECYSSSFFVGADRSQFKEFATKMALESAPAEDPNKLSFDIKERENAYLTFHSNIRHAEGKTILKEFIKFVKYLSSHSVWCEKGKIEIDDEFREDSYILEFNYGTLDIYKMKKLTDKRKNSKIHFLRSIKC